MFCLKGTFSCRPGNGVWLSGLERCSWYQKVVGSKPRVARVTSLLDTWVWPLTPNCSRAWQILLLQKTFRIKLFATFRKKELIFQDQILWNIGPLLVQYYTDQLRDVWKFLCGYIDSPLPAIACAGNSRLVFNFKQHQIDLTDSIPYRRLWKAIVGKRSLGGDRKPLLGGHLLFFNAFFYPSSLHW